ncbi:hypothetical protein AGOR_G00104290 [Albula goreensis]|uniref:Uncharacterized protein n=1 Tax=Albula goreensis TaxID=1534307 RepID=A0A8T3DFX6_9TELE|nr:hypothetical protein AGOR_G00104290 [Albula goreensis]
MASQWVLDIRFLCRIFIFCSKCSLVTHLDITNLVLKKEALISSWLNQECGSQSSLVISRLESQEVSNWAVVKTLVCCHTFLFGKVMCSFWAANLH